MAGGNDRDLPLTEQLIADLRERVDTAVEQVEVVALDLRPTNGGPRPTTDVVVLPPRALLRGRIWVALQRRVNPNPFSRTTKANRLAIEDVSVAVDDGGEEVVGRPVPV